MNFSTDYSKTECNTDKYTQFTGYGYERNGEIYCRNKKMYHDKTDKAYCPNDWTETSNAYYRGGYIKDYNPYCTKMKNKI